MPPQANPLKLNPLQLRTLALLQLVAQEPAYAESLPDTGEAKLLRLPHAHGDHFHVGSVTVSGRDASGLENPSVFRALERKGLIRADETAMIMTQAGLEYDTRMAGLHLHGSSH